MAAAEEFETVVQLIPNDAEMHQNLALAYTRLQRYDLALQYYNRALALDKTLWLCYWNRGGIYHLSKDYKRATASIEEALKYRPNDARIVADLGVVYRDAGNKEKAREYFEKALVIDPSNAKARENMRY
jgi:Flp pilus assembly protein TadD